MFFICSMTQTPPRRNRTATAPQAVRDGLAELVQAGMHVARMIAQAAETETALAEAALQNADSKRVSAVVARTGALAGAFDLVSNEIRLTVLLAERLDRF
jgi:hypothetical protein